VSECVATIPATLKFTVKDCDPTTGEPDSEEGYSDDYQLEDIDLAVSDYVQRVMKVSKFFTQKTEYLLCGTESPIRYRRSPFFRPT
jgi:hypothetical protein